MCLMLNNIQVKENILADEKYKYLFSVEAVNELVNRGIPFREAYLQIGNNIEQNKFSFDATRLLQHTHEGSIGNLCNDEIKKAMELVLKRFDK